MLSESVRVGGLEFEVLTTQQFRPAVQASSAARKVLLVELAEEAGRAN